MFDREFQTDFPGRRGQAFQAFLVAFIPQEPGKT